MIHLTELTWGLVCDQRLLCHCLSLVFKTGRENRTKKLEFRKVLPYLFFPLRSLLPHFLKVLLVILPLEKREILFHSAGSEDGWSAQCSCDILGIAEKFGEGKRWGKFFVSFYLILINRTVQPVWVQTMFRCTVSVLSLLMKQHFQEQDYKENQKIFPSPVELFCSQMFL